MALQGSSEGFIVFYVEYAFLRAIMEEDIDLKRMERVRVLIDTGASDSVLPVSQRSDTPLEETSKCLNGCAYEAVGGHRNVNEGQCHLTTFSQDKDLGIIDSRSLQLTRRLDPYLTWQIRGTRSS